MTAFNLFLNQSVLFGEGVLNGELVINIKSSGRKNFVVVTGKKILKNSSLIQFLDQLNKIGEFVKLFEVTGEPTCEVVDEIVQSIGSKEVDQVIAIGGGSVLDAAKAVSMMLVEKGSLKDYLEGVGTQIPSGNKIPFIAIPTTSGTGSEATKNGVISGTVDEPFKKSFRHDNFIPEVAVLDPLLSVSCPPAITAACGMDTLTQLIESFVSTGSNNFTDAVAESGLSLIAQSLENAVTDGSDLESRGNLAYAAWCSGLTLGNADLGAVHGLAGSLGAHFKIPHGVACGILLPHVSEAVIRQLIKEPTPGSTEFVHLVKYARCGYLLNGEMESGFDIAEGCRKLMQRLKIWSEEFQLGKLSDYGIQKIDCRDLAQSSKSRLSPIQFSTEQLEEILVQAL